MATPLSNGYILPEDGDTNFWDTLEFNIDRVNSHAHNGTDGNPIDIQHLARNTATIDFADWEQIPSQQRWSVTIDLPTGYNLSNSTPIFKSGASVVYPTFAANVDPLKLDVFVNNPITLSVIYV